MKKKISANNEQLATKIQNYKFRIELEFSLANPNEITCKMPFGTKHEEHAPTTTEKRAKMRVKTQKNKTALCWAKIWQNNN